MKKSLIIVTTLLILSLFAVAQVKIGVINPQKVLQNTVRGKQVKDKLEKFSNQKQQKAKTMEDEIKKLEKELMSPALNNDARERKLADLQERKTNLKRYLEDAQRDFQQQYSKEMQTLYKEIMPIIEKVGSQQGFTVVFDLSNSGISYFDKTVDITDEVIKAYDAKVSQQK